MLIDSHAHLLKEYYKKNFEDIVKDTKVFVNIVGYDLKSSREAIDVSRARMFFFASCGFHPYDADKADTKALKELEELLCDDKVIALGEIGLDYFRNLTNFKLQREKFSEQVEIARKRNMPLIIHSRNSFEDTVGILREIGHFKGVFHSFDYSVKELKEVLDLGFYVSFSGMATFKKRQDLREVMKSTPIDKILFETDSPYLTPEPYRGHINVPNNVSRIYELYSILSGLSLDEIQKKIAENFEMLFSVKLRYKEDIHV